MIINKFLVVLIFMIYLGCSFANILVIQSYDVDRTDQEFQKLHKKFVEDFAKDKSTLELRSFDVLVDGAESEEVVSFAEFADWNGLQKFHEGNLDFEMKMRNRHWDDIDSMIWESDPDFETVSFQEKKGRSKWLYHCCLLFS